ncbi:MULTISPECIES: ABC transporter ATP-binding protein [Exiguobacterium]|uniref:ATP-binding cassette domain-containing protein n=1 Tax=Exiguobacterium antarcticum TaxID=132920 RepID=A0ABT6R4R6_9BACL|nr:MULTISPECIES: ATP-binding cassette domain-containing protein [Exiguobacterium]AFS70716.1 ABC transporter [Exiguobacterium antarcticum B7]MDI3235937.1 ATP-binding cassette domain-containing protein [Exiguobacterium antarcticum]OIN68008.1 glycine/betaine ABC transporter ATP-binding protein [Exiguobacterium sp. KRL4]
MIEFKAVGKTYPDGTKAVRDLNFTVEQGEIFCLIGPSGCGKTTTMKMVNRLIDHTEGQIWINGQPIMSIDEHQLRRQIGYVLQQIALFPHMTVEENVSVVPQLLKWDKKKIEERVETLFQLTGLNENLRKKYPTELSGGQQQRVGVMRALAAEQDVILMDEPFSALDPISREQLQNDLLRLNDELGKTILFVTHDMNEALKLGSRICLMDEGKIVLIGTKEEILASDDAFVKEFMGQVRGTIQ